MPDESEVIQADLYVEFRLPNGTSVRGKPVPYPEARKMLAVLYDHTSTYGAVQGVIDRFVKLTGISEAEVMELYPTMTGGDFTDAIQNFFFQRSPRPTTKSQSLANRVPAGA